MSGFDIYRMKGLITGWGLLGIVEGVNAHGDRCLSGPWAPCFACEIVSLHRPQGVRNDGESGLHGDATIVTKGIIGMPAGK
jgi:hypothetical protein